MTRRSMTSPRSKPINIPHSTRDHESRGRAYQQQQQQQQQQKSQRFKDTDTHDSNSLYKTELCRSFMESRQCRYGTKCQFAHGENELRRVQRHPKYKTEICRTFHSVGTCPYGVRCRFVHHITEARDADSVKHQLKKAGLSTANAWTNPPDLGNANNSNKNNGQGSQRGGGNGEGMSSNNKAVSPEWNSSVSPALSSVSVVTANTRGGHEPVTDLTAMTSSSSESGHPQGSPDDDSSSFQHMHAPFGGMPPFSLTSQSNTSSNATPSTSYSANSGSTTAVTIEQTTAMSLFANASPLVGPNLLAQANVSVQPQQQQQTLVGNVSSIPAASNNTTNGFAYASLFGPSVAAGGAGAAGHPNQQQQQANANQLAAAQSQSRPHAVSDPLSDAGSSHLSTSPDVEAVEPVWGSGPRSVSPVAPKGRLSIFANLAENQESSVMASMAGYNANAPVFNPNQQPRRFEGPGS